MIYSFSAAPVLNYVVNLVPLDGDINQIRTIDQEPDGGGRTHKGVGAGRWVSTEHFPTVMRWEGPPDAATIGDFNQTNLWNVSERAKDFIEAVEPGIHQFVPVEFVGKDGAHLSSRYFWIVGHRFDSVDHDHTNYVLLGGRMWRTAENVAQSFPQYLPPGTDPHVPPKLVFNKEQIGDAKVWQDKFIDMGGPLVSESFASALRHSGLNGFRLSEAGEAM